jgi:hypothetical protein
VSSCSRNTPEHTHLHRQPTASFAMSQCLRPEAPLSLCHFSKQQNALCVLTAAQLRAVRSSGTADVQTGLVRRTATVKGKLMAGHILTAWTEGKDILPINSVRGGRDSSVATGWTVRGSNPGGTRFFAHVQTGPGTQPASYTMGTGSFPGVKRSGCGADHPPPCSA